MDILQIKNLNFRYPNASEKALCGVDLDIPFGGFVMLYGCSGSGKTTLLKLLKHQVAPFGDRSGDIVYFGKPIGELSDKDHAAQIGFVGQFTDEQIVTDKVWHELAFGLENLGIDKSVIRRRVGETASYFGIQSWYRKNVDELSGGQKQLLNLAAVMVMRPKLLLLDEPCAQLDPIAAGELINVLTRLNRELGTTIIIAEHRTEELFPVADKVVVMKCGEIIAAGKPGEIGVELSDHEEFIGFPSSMRIWKGLSLQGKCPVSVRQSRDMMFERYSDKAGRSVAISQKEPIEAVIKARNVYFRYNKNDDDIISDLSLTVGKGEIYSILGGNGSGKTTALNLIAGLNKPYSGKIEICGKPIHKYKDNSLYRGLLSLMPQEPRAMFLKDTVIEDLDDTLCSSGAGNAAEREADISDCARMLKIEPLLKRHPYDLSGGEIQKCAMAKLLLTKPQILLLDEPTKGLDSAFKHELACVLRRLKSGGMTILAVTHDIEFAAMISDKCALFFDGGVISEGEPHEFFSDNDHYTTAAARISRGLFENAVLCEDVIELCSR